MAEEWDPGQGELTISSLRERFSPPEDFRVSPMRYPPGTKFCGTARRGTLYVLQGQCEFAGNAISAGEFLEHGDLQYSFEVVGNEECEIVHVFPLAHLFGR